MSQLIVFPNNRLEKDIQRSLLPFNLTLKMLLSSKYNLRNNHIYPNGKKYHIFAFCFTLFLSALHIYRTFIVDVIQQNMTRSEGDLFSCISVLYGTTVLFGYTMMCALDFTHNDNNILLIMKIQSIYKSIDFSTDMRCYIFWNWISIIIIICANVIITAIYYENIKTYDIGTILDIVSDIKWIELDINFTIVIRLIVLLTAYLETWIKNVRIMNCEYANDEQYIELFWIYQNIFEAYNLYKKIFHVLVSSYLLYFSPVHVLYGKFIFVYCLVI